MLCTLTISDFYLKIVLSLCYFTIKYIKKNRIIKHYGKNYMLNFRKFLKDKVILTCCLFMKFLSNFFFFFFFFCFLGLCPQNSCLPTPQPQQCWIQAASMTYTTADSNAGSLTHWTRPGFEPASSWLLVGFISTAPQQEFPSYMGFFVCLHPGMWNFPGQESNPCHRGDQSHSSECWILNLLSHQGTPWTIYFKCTLYARICRAILYNISILNIIVYDH